MPHSWPWTGAASPCVEHRASKRLRAGQLTWCHVKDSSRCSSSWRLTCQSRHPTIGSVWISLTRRSWVDATGAKPPNRHPGSSRGDRFLDWLFCRRRERHRFLERCDLDLSFRVGRTYVHCCLPEARRRLDSCSARQKSATRGKSYRGGWTTHEAVSAQRRASSACLTASTRTS
jgi:hypothetical protein